MHGNINGLNKDSSNPDSEDVIDIPEHGQDPDEPENS